MLSGLYPEAGKVKSIFGYQIATMYDFFMVFVVMSGVASLILFLLSEEITEDDARGRIKNRIFCKVIFKITGYGYHSDKKTNSLPFLLRNKKFRKK